MFAVCLPKGYKELQVGLKQLVGASDRNVALQQQIVLQLVFSKASSNIFSAFMLLTVLSEPKLCLGKYPFIKKQSKGRKKCAVDRLCD